VIGAIEAALGPAMDALPSVLARVHRPRPVLHLVGTADVLAGETWLGRRIARLAGFPDRSGSFPIAVTMRVVAHGHETWQRRIGASVLHSTLTALDQGMIEERIGIARFRMRLAADAEGLVMTVVSGRIGPVPVPRALLPRSCARESVAADAFRFDVPIALPLLGRMVRYAGTLAPS
jgi:hypothetical protein